MTTHRSLVTGKGLSPALFALGLTLTTATQLRITDLSFGAGELLLLLWMAMEAAEVARALRSGRLHSLTRLFAWFGFAAATLLTIGSIVGNYLGLASPLDRLHDLGSVLFAIGIAVFALARHDPNTFLATSLRWFIPFWTISQTTLLIFGASTEMFAGLQLWQDSIIGGRFQGWSKNTNQVALAVCTIPVWCLFEIFRQSGRGKRAYYSVLGLAAVAVGFATSTDALILCWLAAGLSGVLACAAHPKASGALQGSILLAFVFAVVVTVAGLLIPGTLSITDSLLSLADQMATKESVEGEGQGNLRLIVWRNGLEAALHSPVVGLGPGAFSGLAGPFQNLEAHNTFIDWTASTGLVGLVAYGMLLSQVAKRAFAAGRYR